MPCKITLGGDYHHKPVHHVLEFLLGEIMVGVLFRQQGHGIDVQTLLGYFETAEVQINHFPLLDDAILAIDRAGSMRDDAVERIGIGPPADSPPLPWK